MKPLYVGRITERQKGFFTLCEWFDNFDDRLSCLNVVSVDTPPNSPRVNYLGKINDWHEALPLSEYILIMNSSYEGCPLVLLEFIKGGGHKICIRDAYWSRFILPENALFKNCDSFLEIMETGGFSLTDIQFATNYSNETRFNKQILGCKSWLFA